MSKINQTRLQERRRGRMYLVRRTRSNWRSRFSSNSDIFSRKFWPRSWSRMSFNCVVLIFESSTRATPALL